ncbi:hypothetical protein J9V81_004439 [Salmonella enterica]|nr:hypothetical protein [Salmonella enterica]
MKNTTKRITFNLFVKANGKLNITVLEGKASKHDKAFEIATGKTLTEMRKNAGIKDGAEWQITSRFDKRHVKPTLTEGESVYCFARASKGDEVYFLAVVKSANGFRAVMHHKSKRNEYGVATTETAKRFRTASTECDVKDVSGTVSTKNGGSFYNDSIQITSSFFCKKEVKEEIVIEEVKEVAPVVESNEVEELKAELASVKAERDALKAELAAIKTASVEIKEEIVVEEVAASIDEELEEVMNFCWGKVEEVETKEEVKEEKEETEEYTPSFDIKALRESFMKKNPVVWEENEEEEHEEVEVDDHEMRMAAESLHDAMFGTNFGAYAYAA